MTTNPFDDDGSSDFPDPEEQKFRARRLFTYSVVALRTAAAIEKIFVNHPQCKATLQALDRVFQLGRELTLPQGVVVVGATGTGKSELIRQFAGSLPRSAAYEDGVGAITVRLQKAPNVGRIVGHLLREIRYPLPQVTASTLAVKRTVLIDALRSYGTRAVLLDEAHHLRGQARMRSRYEDGTMVTDLLREMMDGVPLALGFFGGEDLTDLATIDQHLASRVSARYRLVPFEQGSTWHGFVRAFVRQATAFDLAFLDSPEEVARLHTATQGNLRSFKRLVTEATLVAIDEAAAALQVRHLALAYARVNGEAPGLGNPYGR